MTRLIVRLILALALGTATNLMLIVVLSICYRVHDCNYRLTKAVSPDGSWELTRTETPVGLHVCSIRHKTKGLYGPTEISPLELIPAWSDFAQPTDTFLATRGYEHRVLDAFGWPCLAMWCEGQRSTTTPGGSRLMNPQGAIMFRIPRAFHWTTSKPYRIRNIPLRPIWRGTIVNSMVFATVFWGALFAWRDARRLIRQRRGLCAFCGYPRGAAERCTECGRPMTQA